MDYARAQLIHQLLKDYQDVAQALKALRANHQSLDERQLATLHDHQQEAARSLATGWFNRVFLLYRHNLLAVADIQLVASPRAAQLWLEYVAPLDKGIREAVCGPDPADAVHPTEQFWREYASGKLMLFNQPPVSVN